MLALQSHIWWHDSTSKLQPAMTIHVGSANVAIARTAITKVSVIVLHVLLRFEVVS